MYTKEEFGRFLNRLSEVIEAGVNVVLTAHAQIRKFEQPDELGAYDRYELKLGKKTSSQTSPLVKEWADMLLFANYKTIAVAVDDKGKKHKAQGGYRVMYTAHHPCWDAKNRYGLPDEIPFEYESIAHIIADVPPRQAIVHNVPQAPDPQPEVITPEPKATNEAPVISSTAAGEQMSLPLNAPSQEASTQPASGKSHLDDRIPKNLRDLMELNQVSEWDLTNVVESKGYVPVGTPIWEYDVVNPGIVDGLLVAAWEQVYAAVKEMKEKQEIPFN